MRKGGENKDDATRNILQMSLDVKRNRGRPKVRWRDLVKEYGEKPDDNCDGGRQKTFADHDSSRHTTKCRGGNVRRNSIDCCSMVDILLLTIMFAEDADKGNRSIV